MTSERSRSTGLILQALVVVASILAAFALDAWWSQRAERHVEVAHLRAVRSDFEQNVARLQQLIKHQERVASASRSLLRVADPGITGPPEDSVWSLMVEVFTSTRFDPVLGGYEAVVSSGGLAHVRHSNLRLALADFASLLEGRYYERYADEIYFDFVRGFTGRLGLADAVLALESGSGTQPPPAVAQAQRDLLREAKYREHLALRYLAERDVAGWYRGLHEKASIVLDIAERALPEQR